MSQWKNDDSSANSVLWGVAGFKKRANTVNQANFYGNVTSDAFITNEVVGQFGVDNSEIGVSSGNLYSVTITTNGSGYTANVAMTVTNPASGSGATVNAIANSTGRISSGAIQNAGSSYVISPTLVIPPPANTSFNANSAVDPNSNSFITLSTASRFAAGDLVTYFVAGGNTALAGLTNNTNYYIYSANASVIALSATSGGTKITLTKGLSETGHYIRGQQATAVGTVSGGANLGIPHAGWNVRVVGTGGRAGRVQYETLVAMGSMTSDGSDDSVLPDA